MRDILFRGKRTDNGKWVEGSLEYHPTTKLVFIETPRHIHFDVNLVDPATVGQFTGKKDRSGNRYFEGDIFQTNVDGELFTYFIAWIEDGWCAVEAESKTYQPLHNSWAEISCVCGNIHDNPELLKEE